MGFLTVAASATLFVLAQAQHPITVDLGYAKYTGVTNRTTQLNVFKGIRYAAAPTGELRFAAPQEPPVTGQTFPADQNGPACYQTYFSLGSAEPIAVPETQSEDCLLLNVYAPANTVNSTKLPVLVTIHGGGYGLGDASMADPTPILTAKGNQKLIGISIQYRLGAFGFLSSEDVKQAGALNAAILDIQFALKWVQRYIHIFGGDPSEVTISGESAGAGAVMLQAMAYGGLQGQSLFRYAISQSPYLPKQYRYNEDFPTAQYDNFVAAAGCSEVSGNKLACLRSKPIETLATASNDVSTSGIYGTWAFLPVTDGSLIKYAPTEQLLENYPINGAKLWVGNNAEEGPFFVNQNITTASDLDAYIRTTLPRFTESDIAELLSVYAQTAYATSGSNPRFATSGESTPSALDVSSVAIGSQQTANLIYGELTFVCPSYWLATSYSRGNRTAYKYQYSVPVALHGSDLTAYFGPQTPIQSDDFVFAWRRMFGSFISGGTPNVANEIGNGVSTRNASSNPLSRWPIWGHEQEHDRQQMDFNQTGGIPYVAQLNFGPFFSVNASQTMEPGLKNDFKVVDALSWESERGKRCEFWREKAKRVPF